MPYPARQNFQAGLYKTGDRVKLRHPGEYAGSFDDPHAVLKIETVHRFTLDGRATYVLSEEGGPGVVPFHDDDLIPAADSELQ